MLGYRVLTAENGREALVVYQSERDIALVLTDMVMPEMGGLELIGHLRKENPELKALFTTGHVVKEGEKGLEEDGIEGVISKPFDVDERQQAIRHALEEKHDPARSGDIRSERLQ